MYVLTYLPICPYSNRPIIHFLWTECTLTNSFPISEIYISPFHSFCTIHTHTHTYTQLYTLVIMRWFLLFYILMTLTYNTVWLMVYDSVINDDQILVYVCMHAYIHTPQNPNPKWNLFSIAQNETNYPFVLFIFLTWWSNHVYIYISILFVYLPICNDFYSYIYIYISLIDNKKKDNEWK